MKRIYLSKKTLSKKALKVLIAAGALDEFIAAFNSNKGYQYRVSQGYVDADVVQGDLLIVRGFHWIDFNRSDKTPWTIIDDMLQMGAKDVVDVDGKTYSFVIHDKGKYAIGCQGFTRKDLFAIRDFYLEYKDSFCTRKLQLSSGHEITIKEGEMEYDYRGGTKIGVSLINKILSILHEKQIKG